MKTVLYIDDEADSEKMVSKFEIMNDEGIDVIRVIRVEDALPVLAREIHRIDLIVLDLIMPPEETYTLEETNGGTTTGISLLKDIRSKYKRIPIIIVSIKRRGRIEHIISMYAVSEYLEKPISANDLVKAIKKIVNSNK